MIAADLVCEDFPGAVKGLDMKMAWDLAPRVEPLTQIPVDM